jgi:LPPG:FO 2-phospho-L-lactate transferase
VLLAGGTGGAKLARGMLDVVGGERLTVIANTGDDIEIYGAYVSPDPDLVTFWLADLIDERGWGLKDDSFQVMEGLRKLGVDVWFELGDRDLAIGLERARRLDDGERLTKVHSGIATALKAPGTVLPMSDYPVRTRVMSAAGSWSTLQEFLIKHRGDEVGDVDFRGARAASPTPEVLEAIRTAQAIIIGPSNPVISIGPILALQGMRAAIASSPAPVIAVSPIVDGQIVKGPTDAFMRWSGRPATATGIAQAYDDVIDGLVADEPTTLTNTLQTNVLMDTPQTRSELARRTLTFALSLP